jgi:hypothetical protein
MLTELTHLILCSCATSVFSCFLSEILWNDNVPPSSPIASSVSCNHYTLGWTWTPPVNWQDWYLTNRAATFCLYSTMTDLSHHIPIHLANHLYTMQLVLYLLCLWLFHVWLCNLLINKSQRTNNVHTRLSDQKPFIITQNVLTHCTQSSSESIVSKTCNQIPWFTLI